MPTEKLDRKRAPTNTERASEKDALGYISKMAAVGVDAALALDEAKGQAEVCASDTLPTDSHDWDIFERFGGVRGEAVPGDDLFTFVTLPEGWSVVAGGHSHFWSDLVDNKGRRRGGIFYKAAFYDRKAYWHAARRFDVGDAEDIDDYMDPTRVVLDCGKEVFRAPDKDAARAWLDEHYPRWADVGAYWDEE